MIAGCKDAVINCLKNEGSNLVPFTPTCGPTPPPTPPTPAPCAAGKFYNTTAGGTCVSCSPGMFAVGPGATSCASCPAGKFDYCVSSGKCASVGSGAQSCVSCPAGKFAVGRGAASCVSCSIGTSALGPGATSCVSCSVGTFALGPGAAICVSCFAGTFAVGPGAMSCVSCSVGKFAVGPGATSCASCPAGKFDYCVSSGKCALVGSGAASCASCSAGKFAVGLGATSCVSCSAGTFAVGLGATSCVSCSAGKFAVGPGATSCEACADNMTTSLSQVHLPMVGATRAGLCSDSCNGGHFWDAQLRPGATTGSCVPCPAGKFVYAPFRATVSKQQCAVCGKGNVYNDGLDTARSGQSHGPGEFCDQKCPGGKYNDLLPANATEGHTSCQLCPAGTRRALKEDMYDRPGYGSGRRRRLQGRRRIGLSQPLNGQFSSVCVPCKPGSWDDRVGSDDVDCKACPEGRCVSC